LRRYRAIRLAFPLSHRPHLADLLPIGHHPQPAADQALEANATA
jgi:hypothetical protein